MKNQLIKAHIAPEPGELWIMIALYERYFRDDSDRVLCESIIAYIEASEIGVYSGESSGGKVMDISFSVINKADAAQAVYRFIVAHFPDVLFYISDRYEPIVEHFIE